MNGRRLPAFVWTIDGRTRLSNRVRRFDRMRKAVLAETPAYAVAYRDSRHYIRRLYARAIGIARAWRAGRMVALVFRRILAASQSRCEGERFIVDNMQLCSSVPGDLGLPVTGVGPERRVRGSWAEESGWRVRLESQAGESGWRVWLESQVKESGWRVRSERQVRIEYGRVFFQFAAGDILGLATCWC